MRREFVEYMDSLPIKVSYQNIIGYPIHWHDSMEIIYVLKGSIKIVIETETHIVNTEEIEIINYDEAHSIQALDKNNRVLIFQIDNSFFDKYYNIENMFFYTESTGKDVQKSEKYEKLRTFLSILLCEAAQKSEDYEDAIEDTLVEILYHLINNFHYLIYDEESLKENEEQFERYDRIIKYIYSNYNNKISLQDIARREYLSSHYLSYGMKNTVGYSFNDFVNLTRVEEAIKLLLDTDKTISEISEELGFSHTRYFNKHFKKHYKCTPMQYRKKYKIDEEKYLQMKKFINYPIKEALEEVFYYIEDYSRYNYEGKISKIILDSYEGEEELEKTWHNIINLGIAKNILRKNQIKLIEETQNEIEFNYGVLREVFSYDMEIYTIRETNFFSWNQVEQVIKSIIRLNIKPIIYIEDDFNNIEFIKKIIESFISFFINIFGETEVKKWKFMINKEDTDFNNLLIETINNNFDIEVLQENLTSVNINSIYDSSYMIPYIINGFLNEEIDIGIPVLFDEFPINHNIDNELFYGGRGLINKQGIKKPHYYAYYLLSKLGDKIITKGEGYIITGKEEDIQILIYSYNDGLNELISLENLYKGKGIKSILDKKFSINLGGLSQDYRIIKYEINEKVGSCYDYWKSMGKPISVKEEEIEILRRVSFPRLNLFYAKRTPIYNLFLKLEGYGAVFIEMQKVQKHL